MIEAVRIRVNGSSSIVTIPKQFLRAANFITGSAVVWELLEDGSLRLSAIRDRRLQVFSPAEALSAAATQATK